MNCKRKYPFRLGCTSYVLPDDILPNVRFMAEKVDDIELVLFESRGGSNLPDKRVVSSMQHIAENEDITFSVHFPIDRRAASENPDERREFLNSAIDIVRMAESLPVSGYVLHLEGLNANPNQRDIHSWRMHAEEFCERFLQGMSTDPNSICVENLGYPPELHTQVVDKYHFSHCIDIGHLWNGTVPWEPYVYDSLEATKIIHLHGVEGHRDHRPLTVHSQQEQLQLFISIIRDFSGVVTLEVFGMDDTFSTMRRFEELWDRLPS